MLELASGSLTASTSRSKQAVPTEGGSRLGGADTGYPANRKQPVTRAGTSADPLSGAGEVLREQDHEAVADGADAHARVVGVEDVGAVPGGVHEGILCLCCVERK
jgi:hypothetical protein